MLQKEIFDFLSELKRNNCKAWFDENRKTYTRLKLEFEHFINVIIHEIAHFDKEASMSTAKESIFRINRDIRFTNDKSPYKTNFGAYISKGGKKGGFAGYYIHVEPGECFLAGGVYSPSPEALKKIRNEIFENYDEFKEILHSPSFQKHFGKELWGEKLKTAPKGFPKDFKGIDDLKYKHYTIDTKVPDDFYCTKDSVGKIISVFQVMTKFNAFLNHALNED